MTAQLAATIAVTMVQNAGQTCSAGSRVLVERRAHDRVEALAASSSRRASTARCPANELAQQEVFGPVLSVLPFEDEADAVRLVNGTDHGLMAAVWSGDGNRAVRVSRGTKAGQVHINSFGAGVELPFCGMRKPRKGLRGPARPVADQDDNHEARLKAAGMKHG